MQIREWWLGGDLRLNTEAQPGPQREPMLSRSELVEP